MRHINEERLDFRKKIEEDFLGIALIELKEAQNIIDKTDDTFFYFTKHKQIINALKNNLKKESDVSLFDVYNSCTKDPNNEVELIDIVTITNNTSTTAGLQNIFLILLEFKMEDDLYNQSEKTIEYINAGRKDIVEIYDSISDMIESNISKARIGVKEDDIKDVMDKLEASINEKLLNPNQITGIPSGMASLDKQLLGFNKKDFVIIAARPSMGKTAFVTTIAKNIAVYAKVPTAFFSLEMSSEQLVTRVLSSHSGVGIKKINQGDLSDIEKAQVKQSIEAIKESPLYLYDQASLSITDFKSKVKEIVEQKGVKIVIVDYIQLMSGTGQKQRNEEISFISRGLKTVAKELDITVIGLAQLSRETEKRGDKSPQLSDLKESGSLEQDADAVIFLHRPEYYGILEGSNGESMQGLAEIIFGKNRKGERGAKEKMSWIGETNTFMETVDTITSEQYRDYTEKIKSFELEDPF